ncbi:hypothetical protein G6F26_008191 [Rhizopus arrhizus]|nr:hypothetical protein G6F26_008191 [Rhizopus arrhizus]
MEQLLSNMLQEMPADQVANVTAELEEQEALEAQESPPVRSSSGYYLLNRLFPQDESASLLQKYPRAIDNQDDDLIIERNIPPPAYKQQGPESPSIAPISIHICGKISNSESWFLDSTCWISSGMAIKMAQDLGLHRSSFQNQGLSEAESAGRKRLWWSAYVIDRFVSASVSRPMTISDADCDLEYPDETEYVEFVHTIKLSRIVGEAHKALRSPKFQQLPDRKARTENTCRYIQQRLDEWRNDLPPQFRLTDKELEQMFQPGLLDPKLKSKLNSGAGQFHLAYITVCLMTKKHLMCTASYYLEIARECQKLIRESVYILSSTHLESLLYSWCFSSFFLSEALGVIFLICRISDPEIASEARGFCESLKKCYGYLEKITGRPSVVPYIEVLLDISSRASGSSSQDAIQENQKLEYDSLAESIDGIEWGGSVFPSSY